MGTFIGHAIPAGMFFFFGMIQLMISLKRSRSLPESQHPHHQSQSSLFCEMYVPETNPFLLRLLAVCTVFLGSVGIFYEADFACPLAPGFETCFTSHNALFFSFAAVGPIAWLECTKKLPKDSWRVMIALALLLSSVLWNEHALMKTEPANIRIHVLLAQVTFVHFIVMMYSVQNPNHLPAFIASQALFVITAVWIFTAGVHLKKPIMVHFVGPLLGFETVGQTLIIVVTCALFAGNPSKSHRTTTTSDNTEKEYECLQTTIPPSPLDDQDQDFS